jgi:hypothetical protein
MADGGVAIVSGRSKTKFLGVKEPDFSEAGSALADLIRRRILAAPGGRWNRTGRLLGSIATIENGGRISVIAGGDRLQRDELAQKFADEIIPTDLDEETRTAIAEAIFNSFKVEK